MQDIDAKRLERLVSAMFAHAESTAEAAQTIARHLVAANLVDHDFHRVIRADHR
jgi:LDH2 family malate/lactate/ureidoglycolate dehydrogenase